MINHAVPKIQKNAVTYNKWSWKCPVWRKTQGRHSANVCFSPGGSSMIHFSFSQTPVHKRFPVSRPQSLDFVEVISGWKSRVGKKWSCIGCAEENKRSYNELCLIIIAKNTYYPLCHYWYLPNNSYYRFTTTESLFSFAIWWCLVSFRENEGSFHSCKLLLSLANCYFP